MHHHLTLSLVFSLLVAACGAVPRSSGGDILVIGDSVLAWNRFSGQDVGPQVEAALGRDVVSRATPGARLRSGRLGQLAGLSIPDQLSGSSWKWVVMNGGANDLASACGCQTCDAEVETLISSSGTGGVIPALISRARAQGARVVWAGYHEAPASGSFGGCRPALVEMEKRIAAYAEQTDGVYFVDIEDVLDPAVPGLLASDRTHPGPVGSRLIAQLLARQISGASEK